MSITTARRRAGSDTFVATTCAAEGSRAKLSVPRRGVQGRSKWAAGDGFAWLSTRQ